jgi:hypothetical protein
MTLAEFLLARIAEDERWISAYAVTSIPEHSAFGRWLRADGEAKRRILGLHPESPAAVCNTCTEFGGYEGAEYVYYPCPTLCALVLPYADHPDFRAEWRITGDAPAS